MALQSEQRLASLQCIGDYPNVGTHLAAENYQAFGQFDLRQRQQLPDIAAGMTAQESADRLGVSKKYVQDVRLALRHNLGAFSLPQVVYMSLVVGEVPHQSTGFYQNLTPSEAEVVSLAALGFSRTESAVLLGVTKHAVVERRRRMMHRWGVDIIERSILRAFETKMWRPTV